MTHIKYAYIYSTVGLSFISAKLSIIQNCIFKLFTYHTKTQIKQTFIILLVEHDVKATKTKMLHFYENDLRLQNLIIHFMADLIPQHQKVSHIYSNQ